MSVERQILEANTAFYEAFKEKDIELMNDVWAEEHDVICIHPGWQALCGREAIMSSFDRIGGCKVTKVSHLARVDG